ncbi:MAG: hypothetical protein INF43_04710 [Alphaproteobacteria bacterium]|jgi:hypothetical protein|nr:hypothetical protein [Alphaproteobacteria bacterium]
MKTLWLVLALLGLNTVVIAQERSSGARESVVTTQTDTELRNELEALKGQLKAVQDETKRRMACQQTTRVSTATGCVDIPGLEDKVRARKNP